LQNRFLRTLFLLVILNLLVKPIWIFAIDRRVQNITGFAAYGAYYAMLSFCFLFTMVLDPGLNIRLSRDAASHPDRLPRILSEAIRLKLFLILCFWVLLIPTAAMAGITDWGTLLSVALLFTCSSFMSMVRHFMSGAQFFRQEAWLSVVDKSIVILLVGSLMLLPHAASIVTVRVFVWVQVAALMKAGRNAGFRLKPLIKLARVFRDPGQGLGRHAGRGDEPCRMPGGAGGQLIPLQHQDVRPAGLGEVIGRRGADDAAPDNNGAGMGGKGLRQGVTPKVR